MSYERPAWAGGAAPAPPDMPRIKAITVDTNELVRTRDALGAAFLGLSAAMDRAVKAYLDHIQVVINGDGSLNVSYLLEPFNVFANLGNPAALAQMALQQGNGTIAPMMINNSLPVVPTEEATVKGKRKKRAYKQRDPNAPKRPLTAYFRYLGENRGAIAEEIKEHPEMFASSGKPGDISRVATDRWNALTTEQQEPYRNAYQAALKEYEKEVERYKASGGSADALDATKVGDAAVGAIAIEAVVPASDSSDSDEDEDAVVAPPPPPAPVEKAPKKPSVKKTKAAAAPAVFSTINPAAAVAVAPAPVAPVVASSSSPERKRKGATDAEGGAKKRSRKSAAEVVAAPDPVPVPAPVVAPSSPEVEAGGKKKKSKKKKDA